MRARLKPTGVTRLAGTCGNRAESIRLDMADLPPPHASPGRVTVKYEYVLYAIAVIVATGVTLLLACVFGQLD